MLQQQAPELRKLDLDNQANNEKLEQYGRRLCLRIDGVPLETNETSEDVLDSVKNLFGLAEMNIPDRVVDSAHRIRRIYNDCVSNKTCKGITVKFTTFRHRTM